MFQCPRLRVLGTNMCRRRNWHQLTGDTPHVVGSTRLWRRFFKSKPRISLSGRRGQPTHHNPRRRTSQSTSFDVYTFTRLSFLDGRNVREQDLGRVQSSFRSVDQDPLWLGSTWETKVIECIKENVVFIRKDYVCHILKEEKEGFCLLTSQLSNFHVSSSPINYLGKRFLLSSPPKGSRV